MICRTLRHFFYHKTHRRTRWSLICISWQVVVADVVVTVVFDEAVTVGTAVVWDIADVVVSVAVGIMVVLNELWNGVLWCMPFIVHVES